MKRTDDERFWSKVDPCRTDGCALWLGATQHYGHGAFRVGDKVISAHHYLVGKPAKGYDWDHVRERGCTHTNCIWPEHLELVTHRVNVQRGNVGQHNAIKTHCPKGHEYTAANTRHYRGMRYCRQCQRGGRHLTVGVNSW